MPAVVQGLSRVVLGQLFVRRVLSLLQGSGAMALMMGQGGSVAARADLDRAAALFDAVADGPSAVTEMRDAAAMLRKMTDMLRDLVCGTGGLDPMRMMRTLGGLQDLMRQPASPSSMSGLGSLPLAFAGTTLANLPPIDRPTVVIEPAAPETTRPETARPRPARPPSEFLDDLRQALLDRLPGLGPGALCSLLDGTARLPVDRIDELVAIGSMLVEAPGVTARDHLLFAVALHLRGRVDDGGWSTGDEDVRAAAAALLAGAEGLPDEAADVVVAAAELAALLDDRLPELSVRPQLGAAFSAVAVAAAVAAVGAGALLYTTADATLVLMAGNPILATLTPGATLPPRILAVGRYIDDGAAAVSHVGCGTDVVRLAGRARRPVAESASFLADPRRDRPQAALDAMLLRRSFYPRSAGYGNTLEQSVGPGTPHDAVAALGSALIHLGCGITADGGLELAGDAVLDASAVAGDGPGTTGGLAVLPPVTAGADVRPDPCCTVAAPRWSASASR